MQGQRSANRLRMGVPASLTFTHDRRPCLLDDISASGAHLRIEGNFAKGSMAQFNFHELHVLATVVWTKPGECGVRFEKPLEPEDMQGMLWITQNREAYDRICSNSHAQEWTQGIWE